MNLPEFDICDVSPVGPVLVSVTRLTLTYTLTWTGDICHVSPVGPVGPVLVTPHTVHIDLDWCL